MAHLRTLFVPAALAAAVVLQAGCTSAPDYGRELPPGMAALIPLGPKEPVPDLGPQWHEREEILAALDRSIAWMRRPRAATLYPVDGIPHARALASLERFRELLADSRGPDDFRRAVERDFQWYVSAGWDARGGGVLFTAYCTPILRGSLEPSPRHRYPLYALPPDLEKSPDGTSAKWVTAGGALPYPERRAIEANGLLEGRGLELVWLADPMDAYIAHVNGSAFVELEDGSMLRLGYAGTNGRPYRSLGAELVRDGRIEGGASIPKIRAWAASASERELAEYLHRNPRFSFFQVIDATPHGCLDFPVTAERSIATDKELFPPGALCFVEAEVPAPGGGGPQPYRKLVLDQDRGGAIRTAGRADLYLGIGPEAEDRAGRTHAEGQLYYLFLKEGAAPAS